MEELIGYVRKIKPNKDLLKLCHIHLLTIEELKKFSESKDDWRFNLKISIEYDVIYDKLYIGPYNEVADSLKVMFITLSLFKAVAVLKSKANDLESLMEAMRIIDVAVMIGCGLDECSLLTDFNQKLHDYTVDIHTPILAESNLNEAPSSSDEKCEIESVIQPSIEHFWTKYLYLHQPVKMLNCLNHWPALEKWKDVNYFIKHAGFRTVPIELGKTYDDDKWGQSLFKLKDFFKKFVSSESQMVGYLAQHDLFEQIPRFKNDFFVPDYCALTPAEPIVKAWIGPKNTVSPMHTDDKHNLFCQVVGEKLIILAAPNEGENLYQHDGLLSNTSTIDAENLDFERFPLLKNVKFSHVILKAGDMIFIPKFWWHYCRSLTKSISISFWFDIDDDDE